jgi:hypothetical protein
MTAKPKRRRLDMWPDKEHSAKTRLYHLLYTALPDFRTPNQFLDVRKLAEEIGISHEGVYLWLRADRLPPKRVKALVELSRNKLSKGTLVKYVLNV